MALAGICINALSPQEVEVNFAGNLARLVDRDTTYGYALARTLALVELDHEVLSDDHGTHMRIEGSVAIAQASLRELQDPPNPALRRQIGLTARYGALKEPWFQPYNRIIIRDTLGKLTEQTIPELPKSTPLGDLCLAILDPLAAQLGESGIRGGYVHANAAPWHPRPATPPAE